jgi:hypothetical protein
MPGASTVTVRVLGDASHLEKTLATTEGTVGGHLGNIGGKAKEAGGHVDNLGKSGDGAGGGLKNLAGGLATVAGGLAAIEIGKGLYESFNKDEEATKRLEAAMKSAGEKSTPELMDALEKAKEAGARFGFSADQTTDSIARMRLAGVSTADAIKYQSEIEDLARAKQIPLADATQAVVMALGGKSKMLKQLGIDLPPVHGGVVALTGAQHALELATQASNKADEQLVLAKEKAAKAFQAYSDASAKFGEGSKQSAAAQATYEAAVRGVQTAAQNSTNAHDKLTGAQQKLASVTADTSDRTHNLGDIMASVHVKTGGQAAAANETLSGKMEAFKAQTELTGEKLMGALMPAMSKLLDGLGFLTEHMNLVIPLLGTIIAAFVVWKTVTVAMSVLNEVTNMVKGLGAALDLLAMNPMVAIGIAIAALVLALVMLELKFHFVEAAATEVGKVVSTVWDGVKTAFETVQHAIGAVLDWCRDHWPLILGILLGPIGIAVALIATHFDNIKGFFEGLIGYFRGAVSKVGDVFDSVGNAIFFPIKTAFNAIANLWNRTVGSLSFSIPDWVPVLGGHGFHMPQIPTFHSGGVIPGPIGQEVLILAQGGERVLPIGAGQPQSKPVTVAPVYNITVTGTTEQQVAILRAELTRAFDDLTQQLNTARAA